MNLTRFQARMMARSVVKHMPLVDQQRVKAAHVIRKLTDGVLTVRVFLTPTMPADPEPFIFNPEEL